MDAPRLGADLPAIVFGGSGKPLPAHPFKRDSREMAP